MHKNYSGGLFYNRDDKRSRQMFRCCLPRASGTVYSHQQPTETGHLFVSAAFTLIWVQDVTPEKKTNPKQNHCVFFGGKFSRCCFQFCRRWFISGLLSVGDHNRMPTANCTGLLLLLLFTSKQTRGINASPPFELEASVTQEQSDIPKGRRFPGDKSLDFAKRKKV